MNIINYMYKNQYLWNNSKLYDQENGEVTSLLFLWEKKSRLKIDWPSQMSEILSHIEAE
jgi:hypothetical protein